MSQANEYKPVPVEVALQVAQQFEKDGVIIVTLDKAHDLFHCTTYGKSHEDKVVVARWGDDVMALLSPAPEQRQAFEDFRPEPGGSRGVDLIAAERVRQLQKGYTPEHDDGHTGTKNPARMPELLRAAVCYMAQWEVSVEWPWPAEPIKLTPDDRITELVKAGALIAAEIDRLQRLQAQQAEGGQG